MIVQLSSMHILLTKNNSNRILLANWSWIMLWGMFRYQFHHFITICNLKSIKVHVLLHLVWLRSDIIAHRIWPYTIILISYNWMFRMLVDLLGTSSVIRTTILFIFSGGSLSSPLLLLLSSFWGLFLPDLMPFRVQVCSLLSLGSSFWPCLFWPWVNLSSLRLRLQDPFWMF